MFVAWNLFSNQNSRIFAKFLFIIQPRKTRIILEWGIPLRKNFAREYTRIIGNYVILSSVCKIIICVCCFFVLCCLNLSVLRRQLFDELAYFLFLLLNKWAALGSFPFTSWLCFPNPADITPFFLLADQRLLQLQVFLNASISCISVLPFCSAIPYRHFSLNLILALSSAFLSFEKWMAIDWKFHLKSSSHQSMMFFYTIFISLKFS